MNKFSGLSPVRPALIALFMFLLAGGALAAGVTDPIFGIDGRVIFRAPGSNTDVKDMIAQPNGAVVLVSLGTFFENSVLRTKSVVSRLQPNGADDSAFGINGDVILLSEYRHLVVNDIELQADGKIVGVGYVADENGLKDFMAFRMWPNGDMDANFGAGGFVIINQDRDDQFTKAAVQADGKIVATGATTDETQPTWWLAVMARFNANGTRDASFNGGFLNTRLYAFGGPFIYQRPSDIEVLPDGRIFIGGTYNWFRPDEDELGFYIQMVRADGTLDTDFDLQGQRRYGVLSNLGWTQGTFDADILTDGTVAIAAGTRVMVTDFAGYGKSFPQSGGAVTALPNNRFIVSGGDVAGRIKLYSKRSLISTTDLPAKTNVIAVQPGGKVITSVTDNGLSASVLQRYSLIGSQGTRQANFFFGDRADLAVYRASDLTLRAVNSDGAALVRTDIFPYTKTIPEFLEVTQTFFIPSREVVAGWNNGAASGGQAFFAFQRSAGAPTFSSPWGGTNDKPYAGDFNGDGRVDVGVFNTASGVWYGFRNDFMDQNSPTLQWGAAGDKPVPADYDGDGITDYAVYRPSNGSWWVLRSSDGGYSVYSFGIASDIPLTGDFDGDGKSDFTVYRAGQGAWYQMTSSGEFRYNVFGLATDTPVPADYDGDGKCDIAVYRAGAWHLLQSAAGYTVRSWGNPGDVPVTARYDQ